ncbi:hypothetical protein CPAR01_09177 [Colletotrichum paranaense]|uniref:Uncharacterized protein n=1 Tax=Colletotrichum paranaense TaxID=1914294 RepID=A0ABQ9SG45_9PEZI|nr:uncharacterized protein CPAR01_09177 [Colletotrichum paranaense]KAK1535635.1 hypothetical protein CPAR01_09177 [Colletotrichum paranaense]
MRVRRASVQVCALVPTALQRHWFYLVYLRSTVCMYVCMYVIQPEVTNTTTAEATAARQGQHGMTVQEEAVEEDGRKEKRRRRRKKQQHSAAQQWTQAPSPRPPPLLPSPPPPSIRIVAGYPSPLPLTRDLQLAADVDSDGAVVRYVYAVVTGAPALRPCHARSPCSFGVTGWLVAGCCVAGRPLGRYLNYHRYVPQPIHSRFRAPLPPPLSTTSSASRPKDNGPPPSTSSSDPNSHIPPLLILMEPAQQAQVGSILLFWWPGEQTLEPVPVS